MNYSPGGVTWVDVDYVQPAPVAVCWVNEYRARDGRRYRSLPCESKREAVRVGAQEQGVHGSLVVFRWRVRARLPAIFGA